VLAIAACRLGAAPADAIDIARPVGVTRRNARPTGFAAMVYVDNRPLPSGGCYDVVLANILAPTCRAGARSRAGPHDRRRPHHHGVLANRYEHVVAALAPLTVIEVATSGGWAAVTLRR